MIKKIPVDRLSVGMYVCGNDRKWLETPFFRSKFMLKTEQQLADLREYCSFVFIDTRKGADVSGPGETAATNEGQMNAESIQTDVYPEGGIVELNNGQLAIVVKRNPTASLSPEILLLTDSHKNMLPAPESLKLADAHADLSIVNQLDADDPLIELIRLFLNPVPAKDV